MLPGTTDEADFAILIATFAKAIQDLRLDVVVIVEHQPRQNEANRLQQLFTALGGSSVGWGVDETQIPYSGAAGSGSGFGGLQFGLLWRTAKVQIDPTADQLLTALRQPSGGDPQRMRVPWLVPATIGSLEVDLMVLHLKSGGTAPQFDEVVAIEQHIRTRQSAAQPRHLIVLGDWNIRPDTSSGRSRLRRMAVPTTQGNLMRVLTVEDIPPFLDGWDEVSPRLDFDSVLARSVPFSHFNPSSADTLLDHIAISRTLSEIYDHPVRVELAGGGTDIVDGIRIMRPRLPEDTYSELTDHLPVVLTIRTDGGQTVVTPIAPMEIVAAIPNPTGDDRVGEVVRVRNNTGAAVSLVGWRIGDSTGTQFWTLDATDGQVAPGATISIIRRERPMSLNNTGDDIVLLDPSSAEVDRESYGSASSGQVISFQ